MNFRSFESNSSRFLQLAKFEQMLPIYEMSYEEYARTFPNWFPTYKSKYYEFAYIQPSVSRKELQERRDFHKEFDSEAYF